MTYKPVKTDFVWTGDGWGNNYARRLKQLKRVEDWAIYERTFAKSGNLESYEVVHIKRHDGITLGGQFIPPAETYPGACQFGQAAWSVLTLQRAEELLAQKLVEFKAQAVKTAAKNAANAAAGIVYKKRGRPRKLKA